MCIRDRFNPVQLLWINIVMDGPPAQTLGMEGSERNIMTRQPETCLLYTSKYHFQIITKLMNHHYLLKMYFIVEEVNLVIILEY